MTQWPVPYEKRYIKTRFGQVHIIISGPENKPPILLLHASAMSSWAWIYNIKMLNKHYRTYAIDTFSDAGRCVLNDIKVFPNSSKELAEFYKEIMDTLNIQKAHFISTSRGGFSSTNMALFAPEQVEKVVLAEPMGYTGTNSSAIRILFTTIFSISFIHQSTTIWAFGNNPEIQMLVNEWFPLILEGVIFQQMRPHPFTKEQLQSLTMPVLLVLGHKDALVGDPENVIHLVEGIPNIRIETLNIGYLIRV